MSSCTMLELENLREHFCAVDTDKSGTIDREEAQNILVRTSSLKKISKEDVEAALLHSDLELGSIKGEIDYQTFVCMFALHVNLPVDILIREAADSSTASNLPSLYAPANKYNKSLYLYLATVGRAVVRFRRGLSKRQRQQEQRDSEQLHQRFGLSKTRASVSKVLRRMTMAKQFYAPTKPLSMLRIGEALQLSPSTATVDGVNKKIEALTSKLASERGFSPVLHFTLGVLVPAQNKARQKVVEVSSTALLRHLLIEWVEGSEARKLRFLQEVLVDVQRSLETTNDAGEQVAVKSASENISTDLCRAVAAHAVWQLVFGPEQLQAAQLRPLIISILQLLCPLRSKSKQEVEVGENAEDSSAVSIPERIPFSCPSDAEIENSMGALWSIAASSKRPITQALLGSCRHAFEALVFAGETVVLSRAANKADHTELPTSVLQLWLLSGTLAAMSSTEHCRASVARPTAQKKNLQLRLVGLLLHLLIRSLYQRPIRLAVDAEGERTSQKGNELMRERLSATRGYALRAFACVAADAEDMRLGLHRLKLTAGDGINVESICSWLCQQLVELGGHGASRRHGQFGPREVCTATALACFACDDFGNEPRSLSKSVSVDDSHWLRRFGLPMLGSEKCADCLLNYGVVLGKRVRKQLRSMATQQSTHNQCRNARAVIQAVAVSLRACIDHLPSLQRTRDAICGRIVQLLVSILTSLDSLVAVIEGGSGHRASTSVRMSELNRQEAMVSELCATDALIYAICASVDDYAVGASLTLYRRLRAGAGASAAAKRHVLCKICASPDAPRADSLFDIGGKKTECSNILRARFLRVGGLDVAITEFENSVALSSGQQYVKPALQCRQEASRATRHHVSPNEASAAVLELCVATLDQRSTISVSASEVLRLARVFAKTATAIHRRGGGSVSCSGRIAAALYYLVNSPLKNETKFGERRQKSSEAHQSPSLRSILRPTHCTGNEHAMRDFISVLLPTLLRTINNTTVPLFEATICIIWCIVEHCRTNEHLEILVQIDLATTLVSTFDLLVQQLDVKVSEGEKVNCDVRDSNLKLSRRVGLILSIFREIINNPDSERIVQSLLSQPRLLRGVFTIAMCQALPVPQQILAAKVLRLLVLPALPGAMSPSARCTSDNCKDGGELHVQSYVKAMCSIFACTTENMIDERHYIALSLLRVTELFAESAKRNHAAIEALSVAQASKCAASLLRWASHYRRRTPCVKFLDDSASSQLLRDVQLFSTRLLLLMGSALAMEQQRIGTYCFELLLDLGTNEATAEGSYLSAEDLSNNSNRQFRCSPRVKEDAYLLLCQLKRHASNRTRLYKIQLRRPNLRLDSTFERSWSPDDMLMRRITVVTHETPLLSASDEECSRGSDSRESKKIRVQNLPRPASASASRLSRAKSTSYKNNNVSERRERPKTAGPARRWHQRIGHREMSASSSSPSLQQGRETSHTATIVKQGEKGTFTFGLPSRVTQIARLNVNGSSKSADVEDMHHSRRTARTSKSRKPRKALARFKKIQGSRVLSDIPTYDLGDENKWHFVLESEPCAQVLGGHCERREDSPPTRPHSLASLVGCVDDLLGPNFPPLCLFDPILGPPKLGNCPPPPPPRPHLFHPGPDTHERLHQGRGEVGACGAIRDRNFTCVKIPKDPPPSKDPPSKPATEQNTREEEVEVVEKTKPPWNIDHSVFAPRRHESDSKTYWCSTSVDRKSFEWDWKNCVRKSQFKDFLGKFVRNDVLKTKELLRTRYRLISGAFRFYSSIEGGNPHMLEFNEYNMLCTDIRIITDANTSSICSTIFVASSYFGDKLTSKEARLNRECGVFKVRSRQKALVRYEWIEAFVRIAAAIYLLGGGAGGKCHTLCDAVSTLLSQNLIFFLGDELALDTDVFRTARLYTEEVHAVLHSNRGLLRTLFNKYTSIQHGRSNPALEGAKPKERLSRTGWRKLVTDLGLCSQKGAFTQHHNDLIFTLSFLTTVDLLKDWRMASALTYVGFLEAIGRLADVIAIPTPAMLAEYGCDDIVEFYDLAAATGLYEEIDLDPWARDALRLKRWTDHSFGFEINAASASAGVDEDKDGMADRSAMIVDPRPLHIKVAALLKMLRAREQILSKRSNRIVFNSVKKEAFRRAS